jgi:branched-chain amino acid transport system substrate-binding protein
VLELYAASIRRYVTLVAVVVMAFGGLSACAQNSTINDQTPITIGASLSLSGDFGGDGPAMKQGYQLWSDTVNKNGGLLGRPVQLVILDDKSDPGLTAKNYKTLINVDHVNLLFGPFSTLLTKQAAPVARGAGYALIEGAGGGPSVFDPGWGNLFAVSLPVANNLTTFAYYILSLPQAIRPKTAAYATSDDPFTEPQLRVAQQLLEKAGIKTVYDTNPAYDSTKVTGAAVKPYAERVVQSHADVVLLGTLLPEAAAYINVFKKENYNPRALIATAGPDLGQDFVKAVGGVKNTEGAFVPNGWYPRADNFQNAQMVSDYLAQYGGTADQINADVAEAYSVGQVLEQAVNKIQSINNAKLIALLHSSEVFNTVQGSAQFDSKGRNMLAIAYLFQWQAGQFLSVYPSAAAVVNPKLA